MLASDALSQQTNGRLNQQLDAELQQRAGVIANDVGTRSAAAGAAGFDANVLAQLNASDLMQNQYLDKRAGAIDGYLNMSRKTQGDIAGIDLLALAGRRRRQDQGAASSTYYGRQALDFRMENPVYKGSQSLLSSEQNQRAKNLINDDHWLSGVNAKQQELELLTQKLYATVYDKPALLQDSQADKPALLQDSQAVKYFNERMAEVGMIKGGLSMGYNSGVDFVYGNLHSMTPIGSPANALPSHPNFRTLTWGFGLASDAKGQPAWSTKPWRQAVDAGLDTSLARMGNGFLTYGTPLVGTVGIVDMMVTDAINPAYNPTSWDYFSVGTKNVVDWSMSWVGALSPWGVTASLAYTAADYKLSSYEYRPTRPLDGSYEKRSAWHGFGYSVSDSYLNNIEANQRILGPNWNIHGKN